MYHELSTGPANPVSAERAPVSPALRTRSGATSNARDTPELPAIPCKPLLPGPVSNALTPATDADVIVKGPSISSRPAEEAVPVSPDPFDTFRRGVAATWHDSERSVIKALAGVRANVRRGAATVQTSARAMREAVRGTTILTERTLDFPSHVRSHPWLAVGGALLLGLAFGQLSTRLSRPTPRRR